VIPGRPTIEFCRKEQLQAAGEIAQNGWNERGAVLGMADYFAEEFILSELENREGEGISK
jgi:hypothetical protein